MVRRLKVAGVARMVALLFAIAGACTLAASPASAFHFVPEGTRFKATGTIGFAQGQVGYVCTATIQGKTTARGKAKITSLKLTGSDDCTSTKPIHLPWTVKATGPSGGDIKLLGFNGPVGECGPDAGATEVDGAGNWSFDLLLHPTCIVSGSVATNPAITITN